MQMLPPVLLALPASAARRTLGVRLTRDGVTRLSALMVEGGVESVMAAVLAELDTRAAVEG